MDECLYSPRQPPAPPIYDGPPAPPSPHPCSQPRGGYCATLQASPAYGAEYLAVARMLFALYYTSSRDPDNTGPCHTLGHISPPSPPSALPPPWPAMHGEPSPPPLPPPPPPACTPGPMLNIPGLGACYALPIQGA